MEMSEKRDPRSTGRRFTFHNCETRLLIWLFLLALCLRMIDVLLFQGSMILEPGDQADYERIAREFALTGEFMPDSSYRPPLFPWVLGIYYKTFGFSHEGFFYLQALMGASVVLFITLGASRLFNRQVGLWAGLFGACDPVLIHYTTQLLTETLFLFLFTLGGLFLLAKQDYLKLAAGALWALSALCRPIVAGLGIILATIALIKGRRKPRKVAITLMTVLMFCLALSPWVFRNYRIHGAFVPLTTNTGVNLWMGNNENATGWYLYSDLGHQLPSDELQRDRIYMKEAIRYIRENPLKAVSLFFKKVALFWQPYPHPAPTIFLIILGAFSLWGVIRGWPLYPVRMLFAIVLYFNLSTGIFFSAHRFLVPVLPLLHTLAGFGITNLLTKHKQSQK